MKTIDFETEELRSIYQIIGLSNVKGERYKQRERKDKQIIDYLSHISKVVSKLSTKRELVLVDCGCGRAYLSFVANYYFTEIEKRKVKFICIDHNKDVIAAAKDAAEKLGYKNMRFICSDISKAKLDGKADVVYCLHACDAATDMTIAKGIEANANHILSVACCQKQIKDDMRKHPLTSITKHGVYKERLADILADSLRGLILESNGYKVKIFEFISSSETPKNIMIRAEKISSISHMKRHMLKSEYAKIKDMFHIHSRVEDYLKATSR